MRILFLRGNVCGGEGDEEGEVGGAVWGRAGAGGRHSLHALLED